MSLPALVARMAGYQENGRRPNGAVEMASLIVPLVISFGAPFAIALGRGRPPATTASPALPPASLPGLW